MPTLSLCMIVQNEEDFLEQSLNSVKGLVDEIIIVDTGSTDKTKEIAKKFTPKIFEVKWGDDFAVARNESLKQATGNWILILDADEIISLEDHPKIKDLIKQDEVMGYSLIQRNYTNNTSRLGFVFNVGKGSRESKGYLGWFDLGIIRLFVNEERIRFKGEVHEKVDESIKNIGGKVILAPIVIHHYNEGKGWLKYKEKVASYFGMSLKKVKNNPDDARAYYELGVLYRERGDFDSAERAFNQSLELSPQGAETLLELALIKQKQEKGDEAISLFLKLLAQKKRLADAYFGLGFCYFKSNKLEKAAENFKLAFEHNPHFLDAYLNLGGIYEKMNRFEEAVFYLQKAFQLNSKEARIFNNLGVVHERTGNLTMALKCYQKAIDLNYEGKEKLITRIKEINNHLLNQK